MNEKVSCAEAVQVAGRGKISDIQGGGKEQMEACFKQEVEKKIVEEKKK